jgi:ssDNA-binding Zn-finger/Zn-ribbon topoisomerase 1
MQKLPDNQEVEIYCPNCKWPVKLIVKTNRITRNQFLGCPNWPDCNHTQSIPESIVMRLNGQPTLFGDNP